MEPTAADSGFASDIRELLHTHYDLGEVTGVREIHGGYCNRSFAVSATRDGRIRRCFLRRYNPQIEESDIRFEHALLSHLHAHGFDAAAPTIGCRNGDSYVKRPSGESGQPRTVFWALFDFLEGEDKYTWTRNDLADSEFDSAAGILAALHAAGSSFAPPPGADRKQPPISALLPMLPDAVAVFVRKTGDARRCDRLLAAHADSILAVIRRCAAASHRFAGMVRLPVHGDYHPGNLKYRGGKGVGVFDFDWTKIDYRLFDVALALVYFCGIWRGDTAGTLCLDRCRRFLDVYNAACSRAAVVADLTMQEGEMLHAMMAAANLFVLNWDLTDFYEGTAPDDDEYHQYIHHNIRLMHWIEAHETHIRKAAARGG